MAEMQRTVVDRETALSIKACALEKVRILHTDEYTLTGIFGSSWNLPHSKDTQGLLVHIAMNTPGYFLGESFQYNNLVSHSATRAPSCSFCPQLASLLGRALLHRMGLRARSHSSGLRPNKGGWPHRSHDANQ